MLKLLLGLLAGFQACSTVTYPRHDLVDEILKPRRGYTGLTNRACLEYDGDVCKREEIKEYLFSDPAFRESVNKLGFICKVGERRFKVCLNQAGLCRISYKHTGFLHLKKEQTVEFLPASNYQYLIDAHTRCFQKDRYDFEEL